MNDFHVKRLFIALPLDDVARADIVDLMEGYEVEAMRPTEPINLHVTVKFLGNVEDPSIPGIIDALRDAANQTPRFDMDVLRLAAFPTARRAKVLALSLSCPDVITQLFERIESAMTDCGFRREGRAYHPHVTVGRFRTPPQQTPDVGAALGPLTLAIDRVVLMQSLLEPTGPTYLELASFPLS